MMMASTHWKIERILAVSMLGIMPASVYFGGPAWDVALTTSVMLHGFWYVYGIKIPMQLLCSMFCHLLMFDMS